MKNILSVFWLTIWCSSTAVFAAEKIGRIGSAAGEVLINGKETKTGAKLFEGAVVETKEGKATLLLGEDVVIHLGINSHFKVSRFTKSTKARSSSGDMKLKHGKIRALVKSIQKKKKGKFRIRTKAATMGVRGTHIYIDSPEGSGPATFMTISGEAEVQGGSGAPAVTLKANQQTNVSTGSSPSSGPGIQNLNPDAAKATAHEVAPPPTEITSQGHMEDFQADPGGAHLSEFDAIEDPGEFDFDIEDALDFDPSHSIFGVPVQIDVTL